MEAAWSARREACQLVLSDCVVRRCWDQWIREMSFTLRTPSTDQSSRRPPHRTSVSSRTIRRRLAEGHLGSRCPLPALPLTPTHQCLRLEWCHTRGNRTAAEWN
ncbi:transposable element Tcb2 transposase [Trichonephila clavipes]|nr:transposable element Tcb2 transposase [Trichonephila clavipes]